MVRLLSDSARAFVEATAWKTAICEPLAGDASTRNYFRLRKEGQSAVLMDASHCPESIAPFIRINEHLHRLGFSVPLLLHRDEGQSLLLLEDFGDATFASLLEQPCNPEEWHALATDVLIALHKMPRAIPEGLRVYAPEKMLDDIELFLDWRTPGISQIGKAEFRAVWREILPLAHSVPTSLLLRDYHVANLMWLPNRKGVRQAGLLDFQDAYQGPVTYDLMSLLEDARREVSDGLKEKMVDRYLRRFPSLDRSAFAASVAVVAAVRHTRVLAIFERLSRAEGKHEYRKLHSPRVERLLRRALAHPLLAGVKRWMERYGL